MGLILIIIPITILIVGLFNAITGDLWTSIGITALLYLFAYMVIVGLSFLITD